MNLTISLAQLNIQLGQPQANLAQARQSAAEAARRGSQILLLPELWTTGYDLSNAQALAQDNADLLPELKRLACDCHLSIGGSLLLEQDGQVFNTFIFQSPDEADPVTYAKIHLFRLMDEDKWLTPGERLQQFAAPWGQTGLAICYDLRFPEMFRRYALSGVCLVLISAEWPVPRVSHWQTLLRARAIENQYFVAATNCVGVTGPETFGGHSALISPWGEALVEGPADQSALLTAQIDLDLVADVRQRIPIFKDRRPELY